MWTYEGRPASSLQNDPVPLQSQLPQGSVSVRALHTRLCLTTHQARQTSIGSLGIAALEASGIHERLGTEGKGKEKEERH